MNWNNPTIPTDIT